jgi:hypothetical protein
LKDLGAELKHVGVVEEITLVRENPYETKALLPNPLLSPGRVHPARDPTPILSAFSAAREIFERRGKRYAG